MEAEWRRKMNENEERHFKKEQKQIQAPGILVYKTNLCVVRPLNILSEF